MPPWPWVFCQKSTWFFLELALSFFKTGKKQPWGTYVLGNSKIWVKKNCLTDRLFELVKKRHFLKIPEWTPGLVQIFGDTGVCLYFGSQKDQTMSLQYTLSVWVVCLWLWKQSRVGLHTSFRWHQLASHCHGSYSHLKNDEKNYSENSDGWKICDQQIIPLNWYFPLNSIEQGKVIFKYRILLSSPDSMTGVGFQVSSIRVKSKKWLMVYGLTSWDVPDSVAWGRRWSILLITVVDTTVVLLLLLLLLS